MAGKMILDFQKTTRRYLNDEGYPFHAFVLGGDSLSIDKKGPFLLEFPMRVAFYAASVLL